MCFRLYSKAKLLTVSIFNHAFFPLCLIFLAQSILENSKKMHFGRQVRKSIIFIIRNQQFFTSYLICVMQWCAWFCIARIMDYYYLDFGYSCFVAPNSYIRHITKIFYSILFLRQVSLNAKKILLGKGWDPHSQGHLPEFFYWPWFVYVNNFGAEQITNLFQYKHFSFFFGFSFHTCLLLPTLFQLIFM